MDNIDYLLCNEINKLITITFSVEHIYIKTFPDLINVLRQINEENFDKNNLLSDCLK